ncbi:MAG: hypothetical protein LJU34_08730 [Oscillospiraceae bacterium]|nr:hypothetical protein [Oscillospiraceae bacterium]
MSYPISTEIGFTGHESQEEKLDRLTDYVYQLSEQYRYILYLLEQQDDEE